MRGPVVFLVLPDLSRAKVEALSLLGGVPVLVSYTVLRWKPGMIPRLWGLRRSGAVGRVMLDSGAYHLARVGEEVDPGEYAGFALEHGGLWDLVVAPDVPGDPAGTLRRTLVFAQAYPGRFLPVLQGQTPSEYLWSLRALEREGLTERAPRQDGAPVLGVGGLDGEKRRTAWIARLLRALPDTYKYHLFGIGIRVLRGLRRRGLLPLIASTDTTAWLAEIRFRRRTIHNATTTIEANTTALRAYLEKAQALSVVEAYA